MRLLDIFLVDVSDQACQVDFPLALKVVRTNLLWNFFRFVSQMVLEALGSRSIRSGLPRHWVSKQTKQMCMCQANQTLKKTKDEKKQASKNIVHPLVIVVKGGVRKKLTNNNNRSCCGSLRSVRMTNLACALSLDLHHKGRRQPGSSLFSSLLDARIRLMVGTFLLGSMGAFNFG